MDGGAEENGAGVSSIFDGASLGDIEGFVVRILGAGADVEGPFVVGREVGNIVGLKVGCLTIDVGNAEGGIEGNADGTSVSKPQDES